MIQLLLYLATAVGLLVLLLIVVLRRPARAEGSAPALVAAKRSLESLQSGLLPPEFVEKLFGRQDLAYVLSLGSETVSDLFLAERKRLALAWIAQIRTRLRALKEFHVSRARMFSQMSRWTELSLAIQFAELELRCLALHLVIRWRGPFAAPALACRTAAEAGRVCAVLDRSLAFLTSAPASIATETEAN